MKEEQKGSKRGETDSPWPVRHLERRRSMEEGREEGGPLVCAPPWSAGLEKSASLLRHSPP
jgi:hypothetical protein